MSETGSTGTGSTETGSTGPTGDGDEAVKPFDQTNGLVDGLEGDAITGDDDNDDLPLADDFGAHLGAAGDSGSPDGETTFSEEGKP